MLLLSADSDLKLFFFPSRRNAQVLGARGLCVERRRDKRGPSLEEATQTQGAWARRGTEQHARAWVFFPSHPPFPLGEALLIGSITHTLSLSFLEKKSVVEVQEVQEEEERERERERERRSTMGGAGKKGKQQKKNKGQGRGGHSNSNGKGSGGGGNGHGSDGNNSHLNGGGHDNNKRSLRDLDGGGNGPHGENGAAFLDAHGRVERAVPFWQQLSLEERQEMLTIPLEELRRELEDEAEAAACAALKHTRGNGSSNANGSSSGSSMVQDSHDVVFEDDGTYEMGPAYLKAELERGLERLEKHGTWKAWIAWDSLRPQQQQTQEEGGEEDAEEKGNNGDEVDAAMAADDDGNRNGCGGAAGDEAASSSSGSNLEFYDGEEFRHYLQSCYPKELLDMLVERNWNSKLEFEAETQLRLRMQNLLQNVQRNNVQLNSPVGNSKSDPKSDSPHGKGDSSGGQKFDSLDKSGDGPDNSNRRMKLSKRYASRNDQSTIRSNQVELITMMLEALELEHELLYHAFLFPVTEFVCEKIDPANRESSREELFFEDLEKLSLEDVQRICEFLTEKIDGLSSRMKPGDSNEERTKSSDDLCEEEEEEGMGDVDLFQLNAPSKANGVKGRANGSESGKEGNSEAGASLVVNPKWLQHLEERCLSEDGHPMKVDACQNEHKVGLVLDWVYGSIVSTAEKSRDAARKELGRAPPSIEMVYESFIQGLQEQQHLEKKKKRAKGYLEEMVKSRKLNQELTEQMMEMQQELEANKMVSTNPSEDLSDFLPDHIIYEMLKREEMLTEAKLFELYDKQENNDKKLRNIRAQLRQTEPEFERLKHELEELKNNPRTVGNNNLNSDGTYRNQAEMERHRAQLQDAAIEEQIEVQTAFREQGSQLKMLFGKRQQCEIDIGQKEQQIKQLSQWKHTIENMTEKFAQILEEKREEEGGSGKDDVNNAPSAGKASLASGAAADIEQAGGAHEKRRMHFHKEIRKQLYTEKEDRSFFDNIKSVLKDLEKRIDTGCAALSHMETTIVNLACDDPGALIGSNVLLPKHQRRIDLGAEQHMQRKAKEAEDEILRLEVEAELKKKKDEERKQKKRNKQKEEKRLRLQAEKRAKEEALQKLRELELKQKQEEEERLLVEKQKKQAAIELRRKMEEEVIAARRAELLELERAQEVEDVSLGSPADHIQKSTSAEDGDGFIVVETKRQTRDKNTQRNKKYQKNGKRKQDEEGKQKKQAEMELKRRQEEEAAATRREELLQRERAAENEKASQRMQEQELRLQAEKERLQGEMDARRKMEEESMSTRQQRSEMLGANNSNASQQPPPPMMPFLPGPGAPPMMPFLPGPGAPPMMPFMPGPGVPPMMPYLPGPGAPPMMPYLAGPNGAPVIPYLPGPGVPPVFLNAGAPAFVPKKQKGATQKTENGSGKAASQQQHGQRKQKQAKGNKGGRAAGRGNGSNAVSSKGGKNGLAEEQSQETAQSKEQPCPCGLLDGPCVG